MSELKTMTVLEAYQLECNDNDLVYLKSEADKVIAEKDKEIRRYKYKWCLDVSRWCDTKADKVIADKDKEIHRYKYERCIAMAWWCNAELGMLVSTWESKIKHYKKWQKRWLEIAEKFKEVK